jgi:hypothetical protein
VLARPISSWMFDLLFLQRRDYLMRCCIRLSRNCCGNCLHPLVGEPTMGLKVRGVLGYWPAITSTLQRIVQQITPGPSLSRVVSQRSQHCAFFETFTDCIKNLSWHQAAQGESIRSGASALYYTTQSRRWGCARFSEKSLRPKHYCVDSCVEVHTWLQICQLHPNSSSAHWR